MELIDFQKRIAKLESKLVQDKNQLLREFININNPYKIGDTITDHIGSIKFEKIRYSWGGSFFKPTAVYYGVELKKDGASKKNGNKRAVYGSNIL